MREIKFRGKRIFKDTDYWIYGSYYKRTDIDTHLICGNGVEIPVGIETIGQYTGLKDKNGKEIYEGDIIVKHWESLTMVRIISFLNGSFVGTNQPLVEQRFNTFSLYGTEDSKDILEKWEIAGNIYENPELLEEKNI